jgi:hypothetical protein
MVDVSNVPYDELWAEITKRKNAALAQERSDQAILRTIIFEALDSTMSHEAVMRALKQGVGVSDLALFLEGHAHKFNIDINITYCKENPDA